MEKYGNDGTVIRESRGLINALRAFIGFSVSSRRIKRTKLQKVKLVSWAGRAQTDSWFSLQLEQSRNRALYYYIRNQTR